MFFLAPQLTEYYIFYVFTLTNNKHNFYNFFLFIILKTCDFQHLLKHLENQLL